MVLQKLGNYLGRSGPGANAFGKAARPEGDILETTAGLDDPAFFDKANDSVSRGLGKDITDVSALSGGVATIIVGRAK